MKNTALFLALAFVSTMATAQQKDNKCLAGVMLQEELANSPTARQMHDALEEYTQEITQNPSAFKSNAAPLIIPVVIHIMHQYGSENVSDEQVAGAIKTINEDFQKINKELPNVVSAFQSRIANVNLEFRLVQKDPNGNCTNGITRHATPLTNQGRDKAGLQNIVNWNTSTNHRYMQVYVVDEIEDAGGYATFPNSKLTDGIVVRDEQFGISGTSFPSGLSRSTLTHEIGHYLNLYHIWGNGEVGDPTSCNDDDFVGDTPNCAGTSGCNLTQSSCGEPVDNVQNFMDYSNCGIMFTEGQNTRMQAALNHSSGIRSNLWAASNLTFTGTNDGFTPVLCKPIADFNTSSPTGCPGVTMTFYDQSSNATDDASTQWAWTFVGATPSSSTDKNPQISYPNSGTYAVTLKKTNSSGNDTEIKNAYVTIRQTKGIEQFPHSEGFDNAQFPNHPTDANKSWIIESGSVSTWGRSTVAGASGTSSVRIRVQAIDEGLVNSLITPIIDKRSEGAGFKLTFKVAYAKANLESADRLRVLVSDNCGRTWQPRYSKAGTGLSTTTRTVTNNFVPTPTEWREETVSLAPFASDEYIMIKFEVTSDRSTYIYLDDINLESPESIENVSLEEGSFNVFPNPLTGESKIQYSLTTQEEVEISLVDILGKESPVYKGTQQAGEHLHDLSPSNLSPGVYFVRLRMGQQSYTQKIVVL